MADEEARFAKQLNKILSGSDQFKAAYAEIASRNREMVDPYLRGCQQLLIAHGAAALGSLQFLGQAPVGFAEKAPLATAAFCFGFVLAAVGAFFANYVQLQAGARYWEDKADYSRSPSREMWLAVGPAAGSFGILVFTTAWIGLSLVGIV